LNIKNYTSGVPANRSIERIETLLAEAGASNITKDFDSVTKKIASLHFLISVNMFEKPLLIKMPVNVKAVYDIMRDSVKRPRERNYRYKGTIEKIEEQAERTAWKIAEDWLRIELSMVQFKQREFVQIFLTEAVDKNGITFFEKVKENGYQLLLTQ
jgi:hypothetical protein